MRIYIQVIPRARENEIIKISEGEYKVRLTAPPTDGQANRQLISLLADYFDVAKSLVTIVGGKTVRKKMVDILK